MKKEAEQAWAEATALAFKDECRHVGFGEKKLAHRLRGDVKARVRVQKRIDALSLRMREVFAEFLEAFVGFYDLAIQDYPARCAEIEIIPGRRLIDTPAEDQVRWLETRIQAGHRKRLTRLGLESAI